MFQISDPTKGRADDPRPARTRALLIGALFDLIQTKRWDRIRVQDVLDKTGLGRSTFYAHFDNKFDLLTASIPKITLPIAESSNELPNLLPLFEHVDEMQPILLPLMSQPLLSEINDEFQRQMVQSWNTHLETRQIVEPQSEFLATFLAGAFLAVCRSWLATNCQRSAADVCAEYTRMARGAIESVGETNGRFSEV